MTDGDARALLERSIEHAAQRVLEGKLPTTWAGHQLVALIRHWGYLGHGWEMTDAFQEFDHVMIDLECFPDGRMTSDEHIVSAARCTGDGSAVLSTTIPLAAYLFCASASCQAAVAAFLIGRRGR